VHPFRIGYHIHFGFQIIDAESGTTITPAYSVINTVTYEKSQYNGTVCTGLQAQCNATGVTHNSRSRHSTSGAMGLELNISGTTYITPITNMPDYYKSNACFTNKYIIFNTEFNIVVTDYNFTKLDTVCTGLQDQCNATDMQAVRSVFLDVTHNSRSRHSTSVAMGLECNVIGSITICDKSDDNEIQKTYIRGKKVFCTIDDGSIKTCTIYCTKQDAADMNQYLNDCQLFPPEIITNIMSYVGA
jgi:hypothetical protein